MKNHLRKTIIAVLCLSFFASSVGQAWPSWSGRTASATTASTTITVTNK